MFFFYFSEYTVPDNKKYQYNHNDNETTTAKPKQKMRRCGVPNRKVRMLKIIGGSESVKYKWPWHVAIINQHMVRSMRYSYHNTFIYNFIFQEVFCGGTLISSRWVLTANHCIRKYLRVRLNAHDLTKHQGDDIEMPVRIFTYSYVSLPRVIVLSRVISFHVFLF